MIEFQRVWALWLILAAVPAAALLDSIGWKRTLRLLRIMRQEDSAPRHRALRLQASACFLAAVVFALAALAGPFLSGPVYQQALRGIIVFDVSRSMGAEDYAEPMRSRFERAKDALGEALKRWPESEMGLVVFAGEAYVWIPRMRDMRALDWVVRNELELGLAPDEGSNLGSGLAAALAVLLATHEPKESDKNEADRYWKDPETGRINYWRDPETGRIGAVVIVLSDGVPDNLPQETIDAYQRAGVKAVVGGVGSTADIEVTLANGKTYNVPLNEPMLKSAADATGGEYVRIETGRELAEAISRNSDYFFTVKTDTVERDMFQLPLAASILFAALWVLRMTRR